MRKAHDAQPSRFGTVPLTPELQEWTLGKGVLITSCRGQLVSCVRSTSLCTRTHMARASLEQPTSLTCVQYSYGPALIARDRIAAPASCPVGFRRRRHGPLGPPRSYPSGAELLAQRARYQAEVMKEYKAQLKTTPVAAKTYSSAPGITNAQRKVRAEELARRREKVEERIRERTAVLPAPPSVSALSPT